MRGINFKQNPYIKISVIATHKVTDLRFIFAVIVGDIPEFGVMNFIDTGYTLRYGGNNSVLTYNSVVADKFEQIFGLDMVSAYAPHTSAADTCKIQQFGSVTSANLNAACTHGSTHLTTTALRNTMGNGTDVVSRVLWTGHILLFDSAGTKGNPTSNSSNSGRSVVITPYHTVSFGRRCELITCTGRNSQCGNISAHTYTNRSYAVINEQSQRTLMHELSHQLGIFWDHYCFDDGGNGACSNPYCDKCAYGKKEPRHCLMGRQMNIETEDLTTIFCEDCLTTISKYLSSHNQ